MISPLVTAAEVAGFRAEAEARMASRATVRRTTDAPWVNNDELGISHPVWATPLTNVACRVASRKAGSRTERSGDTEVEVALREIHFPNGTVLRDGDLIVVTVGSCAGRVFRAIETTPADAQTALRVPVEEVAARPEWSA